MNRLVLCLLAVALASVKMPAQSSIFWSTSFDCARPWNQKLGLDDRAVCNMGDQLTGWGGWTSAAGNVDEISVAGNNPLGTGMGLRHVRGGANTTDNPEGKNNGGGGIKIDLAQWKPREIWLRYYSRWQAGFRWQWINYTKELYINVSKASGPTFTTAFSSNNRFGLGWVFPTQWTHAGAPGWNWINGAPNACETDKTATTPAFPPGCTSSGPLVRSNGSWHFYEFHINSVSGLMESWVDGHLTGRQTQAIGGGTIDFILVGSNQCCVAIQPDMYTDYDDIAISTTGYIGPLRGTPPPLPNPPGVGRVVQP